MDEDLRERIQIIDQWIEAFQKENSIFRENMPEIFAQLSKLAQAVGSQGDQISEIMKILSSQGKAIEQLKVEIQIIKNILEPEEPGAQMSH